MWLKKRKISVGEETQIKRYVTYPRLFWLFIIGSLLGVVIEGLFCLVQYGQWETHVVSIWGPFCIIYGFGAAGFYVGSVKLRMRSIWIRFFTYTIIGTAVEFLCGWILEYGLHMRAWDYSHQFGNIRGYVSPQMALAWGAFGIVFEKFVPPMEQIFQKMEGRGWTIFCSALTVFMAINFALTGACIIRWKHRHMGFPPANRVEKMLDEHYNDVWMAERFIEWRFIDKHLMQEKVNS